MTEISEIGHHSSSQAPTPHSIILPVNSSLNVGVGVCYVSSVLTTVNGKCKCTVNARKGKRHV